MRRNHFLSVSFVAIPAVLCAMLLLAHRAGAEDADKRAPEAKVAAEPGVQPNGHADHGASGAMNAKFQDAKWVKMMPQFGDRSPEIAILRVDPTTHATQLLIRTPAAFHVRKHWHSANETHTVITGTAVFECGGTREALGPGSFNYMPAKMPHEAWSPAGGIVFITVDGAWDINWIDGPPTELDFAAEANVGQAALGEPASAAEHKMVTPADVKWEAAPLSLPRGSQVAYLDGNPANSGPFTMRIKTLADFKILPHWHPGDEHVTIISGALNIGTGDEFDKSKTTEIPTGGFAIMPARMHHFAWTTQETVIQVHATGPWAVNYINPSDDPRKQEK